MIITYSATTVDVRTNEKTYWFQVKLSGHECTALDIGFNKDAKWVSASGSFINLDPAVKEEVIKATAPMVARVV